MGRAGTTDPCLVHFRRPYTRYTRKEGQKMLLKDFLAKEGTEKNLIGIDSPFEHTGSGRSGKDISPPPEDIADGQTENTFGEKQMALDVYRRRSIYFRAEKDTACPLHRDRRAGFDHRGRQSEERFRRRHRSPRRVVLNRRELLHRFHYRGLSRAMSSKKEQP